VEQAVPPQPELQTHKQERALVVVLKQARVERDESKELAATSWREKIEI
jgi:hypothetical protein